MRRVFRGLVLSLLCVVAFTGALPAAGGGTFFQVSTIPALLQGVYDGEVTFQDLKKHGDFGLGTVNALDGEMIVLNGQFYQIKADGKVYPVPGSFKTPFAELVFFKPDKTIDLREPLDFRELERLLPTLTPTSNLLYAIKIDGDFSYVKARSVPRQPRPYPGLLEAVKHQTVFEFRQVRGTMVGFLLPDYLGGLNVAGCHFHFISADRTQGGHVLDCRIQTARLELQQLRDLVVQLPQTPEFYRAHLTEPRRGEVEKAEK